MVHVTSGALIGCGRGRFVGFAWLTVFSVAGGLRHGAGRARAESRGMARRKSARARLCPVRGGPKRYDILVVLFYVASGFSGKAAALQQDRQRIRRAEFHIFIPIVPFDILQ